MSGREEGFDFLDSKRENPLSFLPKLKVVEKMFCTEEGCSGEINDRSIILPAGCPDKREARYCKKCRAVFLRNGSPVVDKNENRVFFIEEKFYSKNKQGEMESIRIA